MALTDAACRAAKPKEKAYSLSDSGWLYLRVQPTGAKLWRMNYRFDGKQKTLSFGPYPKISLAEARKMRDDAKAQLDAGRDPSKAQPIGVTFETVAEEWLRGYADNWVPAHMQRVVSRLENDIYPEIGHLGIDQIDAPTLLAALRKIEDRGAMEMAKRMRQTCGQIFRYAVASGRAPRNPAADLQDALKPSPRVRHQAALREVDLPDFFKALDTYDGDLRTRIGIELVMHTFVRTGELLGAEWSEFEDDLWRIPAERMKMKREHLVPITPQTSALLQRLRENYPGDKVMPVSTNTMIYALYRMGYHSRATIHGMRSLASTVLNESGLWSADAIERQLAHVSSNQVRAAYNAAQYLPERRRMMTWWSERLDAGRLTR